MTSEAERYLVALKVLGLSPLDAGRWLGVSPDEARQYAVDGPSGAAARAVEMAVSLVGIDRWDVRGGPYEDVDPDGRWMLCADVLSAIHLPPVTQPNPPKPVHDITPPEPTP